MRNTQPQNKTLRPSALARVLTAPLCLTTEKEVSPKKHNVGGQAIIEGIMMRSPKSFAVVCRRPDGQIVVREQIWRSLWDKYRFLKWPFFRGGIVLLESLVNGVSALSFSVQQQEEAMKQAEAAKKGEKIEEKKSGQHSQSAMEKAAFSGLFAVSMLFGLALFVGLPHLLTWLLGLKTDSLLFHLVDGFFKVVILVGYIAAIGLMKDVQRVFMYHGAEHKAIYAYEQDLELTVENAGKQSRFHPRCGTSFLVLVIFVSVLLFAGLLQYKLSSTVIVDHLLKILIKIPLMFPVAGLAYEGIKLSGKHLNHPLVRFVVAPGMWLQRLTTREPDESQLEVSIVALRKALWREQADQKITEADEAVQVFANFNEALPAIKI